MKRIIGFSTGVLFHTISSTSFNMLDICCDVGCTVMELNIHKSPKHIDVLLGLNESAIMFRGYLTGVNMPISIHLPCNIRYLHNDDICDRTNIWRLLQNLEMFCGITKDIDYVVVHPDLVDDWDVFDEISIPVAIENMDNRKKSFRTLQELRDFFQKYPHFKLVFDVQHWVVNGYDFNHIPEVLDEFHDRIVGVHLSGVGSDKYHIPVCRNNQRELVESLQNLPAHIPIVLEGVCVDVDEMRQEIGYVKNILN